MSREKKMMELVWVLNQIMNPAVVELEVHCDENVSYLRSLGYKVEKIINGHWWVEVRPL